MSVRIAAIADLHYGRATAGPKLPAVLQAASEAADVLVICGDLTDYGRAEEADGLARELKQSVRIPIVAVLGNHDYEGHDPAGVASRLKDAGVTVLDGDAIEIQGVGFAGVKGFCGGFGPHTLGAWGEQAIKAFVQESVSEALKLEAALARLRTPTRIVVLHYAPIQATVEGEPQQIYPYLGCGRLEEPIARYDVTAVFHGHAHRGKLEGKTAGGVPVYNVSLPLLSGWNASAPFRIIEVGDARAVAESRGEN
jgi:Icc-related predicted phosphoesterase